MAKFISYFISAIIVSIFLCIFGYIDQADILQNTMNSLTLIALYEICKHEEKRGD